MIDSYLRHLRRDRALSPETVRAYGADLADATAFLGDLQGATSDALQAYLSRLDVAPSTKRRRLTALRGFYTWAQQRGAIDSDPTAAVVAPKSGRPPSPKPFTRAEVERIIDAAEAGAERDVVRALYGMGLRRSELCAATWDDVVGSGRRRMLRVVGKGGRERLVPFVEPGG